MAAGNKEAVKSITCILVAGKVTQDGTAYLEEGEDVQERRILWGSCKEDCDTKIQKQSSTWRWFHPCTHHLSAGHSSTQFIGP